MIEEIYNTNEKGLVKVLEKLKLNQTGIINIDNKSFKIERVK